MIVDTLPVFYYEKVVGYTPSSFVGLVFVGKRIEVGPKKEDKEEAIVVNWTKKESRASP